MNLAGRVGSCAVAAKEENRKNAAVKGKKDLGIITFSGGLSLSLMETLLSRQTRERGGGHRIFGSTV
jgi:hypothetical protein